MKLRPWIFILLGILALSSHAAPLPAPAPVQLNFKAAAVEFNPQFMQFQANLPKLVSSAENAAQAGAKIIVLPEMASSGYSYKNREQINPYLDTIPGKTTALLEIIAKKYQVYIAVGIAELDPNSNLAYNAAALIGPKGYIGKYRKNQLNANDSRWATRGNLGFPVFDTTLGKIALLLCYDDLYIQSLILPSLRGANIIAYLSSSGQMSLPEKDDRFNDSTIANIASVSGWIGTYIIGSSRTDTETNSLSHLSTHFVGGASIWDPNGQRLAQAPLSSLKYPAAASTVYADINPLLYNNAAKQIQAFRRPELYQILNLYREPLNFDSSTERHVINALMLQYQPTENDKKANLSKIQKMMSDAAKKVKFNFAVLPENSLIGMLPSQQTKAAAENLYAFTVQEFSKLARQYKSYIIFSLPEVYLGKYYATVVLMNDQGRITGIYHKTHLNSQDAQWATAGDYLPVFATPLGRIALVLGDEVRYPDLAAVYAAKRADLIAVPSSWSGQYGGPVQIDSGLVAQTYLSNTMNFWYNLAKYAQAYVVVANFVGGKGQYKGSSGLYSLDSVQGHFPPTIAMDNQETAFYISFPTIGSPAWRINQEYLNVGQRVDLNAPLSIDLRNPCLLDWKTRSAGLGFCWDH